MKKGICIALSVMMLLAAAGIILYPLISNAYMERHQSTIQTQYEESIAHIDTAELDNERAKAEQYNTALIPGVRAFSRDALTAAAEEYRNILTTGGTEIMGYVDIPKIGIYLPIYHGTEEESLQRGIGHLLGTSLPVGGESTHAVLTGHSGLSGQKMFSDIGQLEAGDLFFLHILGETLAYEVEEIATVLPEETDRLVIEPGNDLCTLVTCTPYGINTHRLLARGHRAAYTPEAEASAEGALKQGEPVKSTWTSQYLKGVYIGLGAAGGMLILMLAASLLRRERYRPKHERRH